MDSWLNMALLCGLLLIASLQTTNVFSYPQQSRQNKHLETYIHSLQAHYKMHGTEWASKSVFASHLHQLDASCTCQALLLERMLNIYEELFKRMMSEHKEDRKALQYVMNQLKRLKHQYSEEHEVWRELQEINSVKVKNGTTRIGALNDFLQVFNHAFSEKHIEVIFRKNVNNSHYRKVDTYNKPVKHIVQEEPAKPTTTADFVNIGERVTANLDHVIFMEKVNDCHNLTGVICNKSANHIVQEEPAKPTTTADFVNFCLHTGL